MFQWTSAREKAALALANGMTRAEAADEANVTERTIYKWLSDEEFEAEVDRLSLMTDIAGRAERLRIAKRLIRQRVQDDGFILSKHDILDWLKFAQSETDGIKLDLTALLEASTPLADSGSD